MKVITLFENRTISNEYKCSHGLSLYIETKRHKILFDTGVDSSFVYNAEKLGVDLKDIDVVVISHGHYDHGGGLKAFLSINNNAKIYIGRGAFDNHLYKIFGLLNYNIGLDKKLINSSRLIVIDSLFNIDEELTIFNNIKGEILLPEGNNKLLKKNSNGSIEKDDFNHEINLLINENDKYNLFCGCSHKGIINIIDRAQQIINTNINTVIGGFHLMGIDPRKSKSKEFLNELSGLLSKYDVEKYYTCHCTGEKQYNYLHSKMSNLFDIKTGMIIQI